MSPQRSPNEDPNDVEWDSSSGPSSSGIEKGRGRAEPHTVKKRKLNRACDSCRRRKVRCDFVQLPSGDLDKCLNCFSSKTECTFSEEVKSRTNPKKDVRHLEEKVQRAEELLVRLCPDEKTRQALLDGTIDPLTVARACNSTKSTTSGEGSPSLTHEERSRALLDQASLSLRVRMNSYARPPSPEVKVEEDADDVPRLVPFNYHQDRTPSLFMGESSDPQLVIRALRMKQKWETEGRGRTPSSTSRESSVPAPEQHRVASEGRRYEAFLSGRRPMFWNTPSWEHSSPAIFKSNQWLHKFQFPDPSLMDTLLSLYFEHYNVFMPLIHQPTLERELRQGLHRENEAFATTVLLMCALGSRYSDDPEVLLGEEDIERSLSALRNSQKGEAALDEEIWRTRERWRTSLGHSRGWKYFEQTWDARGSLAVILFPSLYDVQASILSVVFLRHTSFPHVAWAVLGVGVRLLQDIGGHRRINGSSRKMSKAQEELLKRACWVMVNQDRMLSMATGRPYALRPEELDMDLPTQCDDEYWDHPDPQQRWKQPSDKPSFITAFVRNIGLLDILGMVLKTIYATKRVFAYWNIDKNVVDKHVVTEVESALNTWIGTLPPHLAWDANQSHTPFLLQSAVLHATFHYIQILVHRPFIPTPRRPAQLGFPSLLICTNAARAILKVCGTISDRGLDVPGETMLSIFSAGTVLLLKAWHTRQARGSDQHFQKDMDEVHKCMRILRAMEARTFLSGRLWDILNGLASGGEVVIMPPLQQQRPSSSGTMKAKNGPSVSNPESDQPQVLHVDSSPSPSLRGSMCDQQTPTAANWRNQSGMSNVIQPGFLSQSFPSSFSSNSQWFHNHSSSVSTSSSAAFSSSAHSHDIETQQAPSFSSLADGGGPLTGPSSMMFNPMMTELPQTDESDFDMQGWPSLDGADPLSLDVGMSNLWDWGIPFQEDDPVAYLVADPLTQWQPHQVGVPLGAAGGGEARGQ